MKSYNQCIIVMLLRWICMLINRLYEFETLLISTTTTKISSKYRTKYGISPSGSSPEGQRVSVVGRGNQQCFVAMRHRPNCLLKFIRYAWSVSCKKLENRDSNRAFIETFAGNCLASICFFLTLFFDII